MNRRDCAIDATYCIAEARVDVTGRAYCKAAKRMAKSGQHGLWPHDFTQKRAVDFHFCHFVPSEREPGMLMVSRHGRCRVYRLHRALVTIGFWLVRLLTTYERVP